MSSIVLAGGRSLRFGWDKLFEVVGGESLIQRVVARLASLTDELIVVTAREQTTLPFPPHLKVRMVADLYPGKGSLGGIYTGLAVSDSFYNLVVACDMPFLNSALLRYMIQLSTAFDLVVPRVAGRVEPLHAVYSRNCLSLIEQLLRQGRLRITDLFDAVKVRYVEDGEVDRFDPEHLSFFNINTESDLARARALVEMRQVE